MSGWPLLAYELRLKVYEELADEYSNPCLTDYSLVCKEWQQFFEKEIYRHITLTRPHFRTFYSFVRRQKHLVKHIWLRIELEPYECDECYHTYTNRASPNDDLELRRSISGLFSILQSWYQGGDSGLTLEISIWSPSDSEHTFRDDVYIDSNLDLIVDLDRPEGPCDEFFRDIDGDDMWRRPYGVGLYPEFDITLPRVPIVTGLLVRRHTRCIVGVPTIQQIIDRLPRLKEIVYEPRRKYWLTPHNDPKLGYGDLMMLKLPDTLRKLTIYEDFNEAHESLILNRNIWMQQQPRVRSPSPEVGIAMAHLSLSLEKLSVSYMTNATQFFDACQGDWVWHNLRELALTTAMLKNMTPATEELLVRAGKFAAKMPKLHFMEIWQGRSKFAAKFCFHRRIIDQWSKVAELRGHELDVLGGQTLDPEDISSHALAVRELQLLCQVAHPASLEEIRLEAINHSLHN
ncbi:hypothetical protein ACHAPT_003150 [Fusarium lateritium]